MPITEAIGLFWIVFGTGIFTAGVAITSIYGTRHIWKCFTRGAAALERDMRDGLLCEDIVRKGRG